MKDLLKQIKENKKISQGFRIVFYGLGLLLIFTGGVKIMIMVFLTIFGFILGKFYERTMSAIRDYRLSQKINTMTYKQAEYEALQKEVDSLRKMANHIRPNNVPYTAQNVRRQPMYDSVDFYTPEDELGGY